MKRAIVIEKFSFHGSQEAKAEEDGGQRNPPMAPPFT